MAWGISFRLRDRAGFSSRDTMDEAINRACDLMADGAEIESISRNGANEHISVGQIQSIIAARAPHPKSRYRVHRGERRGSGPRLKQPKQASASGEEKDTR